MPTSISVDEKVERHVSVLALIFQEVARVGQTKRCPASFEPLGKTCVKVVKVPAVPKCPAQAEITEEGVCAIYVGRISLERT